MLNVDYFATTALFGSSCTRISIFLQSIPQHKNWTEKMFAPVFCSTKTGQREPTTKGRGCYSHTTHNPMIFFDFDIQESSFCILIGLYYNQESV